MFFHRSSLISSLAHHSKSSYDFHLGGWYFVITTKVLYGISIVIYFYPLSMLKVGGSILYKDGPSTVVCSLWNPSFYTFSSSQSHFIFSWFWFMMSASLRMQGYRFWILFNHETTNQLWITYFKFRFYSFHSH